MANHGDIDEIVQVKRSFAGIFFNAVTRKIEKNLQLKHSFQRFGRKTLECNFF
jgi:hypothetical protein